MSKLEEARERLDQAIEEYRKAVAEAFPVGCRVRWNHRRGNRWHTLYGEVTGNASFYYLGGAEVRVRNIDTDKARKIHPSDLQRIDV